MKKSSIFIALVLLLSATAWAQRPEVPEHHDIEIVITKDMPQDVVTQIVNEAKSKGITIEFTEMVLTDDGRIEKLKVHVIFENCGSGSFESDQFERVRLGRNPDGKGCGIHGH